MLNKLIFFFGIISIVIEQMKSKDIVKILSSILYFIIIYKFYVFKNLVSSITIFGPIMIYLFYESLEIFDRVILSWITYILVGLLLYDTNAGKDTYSIFHWIIVRFPILYFLILPIIDNTVPFIIISIIGLIVVVVKWLKVFNIVDFDY